MIQYVQELFGHCGLKLKTYLIQQRLQEEFLVHPSSLSKSYFEILYFSLSYSTLVCPNSWGITGSINVEPATQGLQLVTKDSFKLKRSDEILPDNVVRALLISIRTFLHFPPHHRTIATCTFQFYDRHTFKDILSIINNCMSKSPSLCC